MKMYAILVGINEYPLKPLSQCVGDAQKMKSYLDSISSSFDEMEIIELYDKDATKANVVEKIRSHLYKASDEDVAFFYYSGHGALESSNGVFPDEHNGAIESMVLYSDKMEAKAFLADKEMRYLWHKFPNNPHLVSVVDSCHSGDIVRSYKEDTGDLEMVKRLAGVFSPREYSEFIFAGDTNVESNKEGSTVVNIPMKNSIHIGACLASESSWEDNKGGVFTRYLLQLLESTQGKINYLDIARWAKMSIAEVTSKKQTPKIAVQGKGVLGSYSPWLKLHAEGEGMDSAVVVNNAKKGWIYSRGALLGVKKGMEIHIDVNGKNVVGTVKEVSVEDATLSIDIADASEMDTIGSYSAKSTATTYAPLSVGINNIDFNEEAEAKVREYLAENELVSVVDSSIAMFSINIFNDFVYYSLTEAEFQPLNRQIDVMELDSDDSKSQFKDDLASFIKWNHFHSLNNPSQDYRTPAIKVEARVDEGEWQDVTEGTLRLDPENERFNNGLYAKAFELKVTNMTREILHVGVLTLASDIGISSNPFKSEVVELQPNGDNGDSKLFYDHSGSVAGTSLDPYKELYNWKEEWFNYKFIFNNFEDFTGSLNSNDFLQGAVQNPLTLTELRSGRPKGELSFSKMKKVQKKWGTCMTRIELSNPTYNMITGDLANDFEEYEQSEELGPFIKELYFEDVWNGSAFELQLKPNANQNPEEAAKATDVWVVKKLNAFYGGIRRRRFRRQKNRPGPVGIAEGDSWFLYPKPGVRDTLDFIMDDYRLLSLADAGDEIADYIKNNELITAVGEIKPDFVLISGGGNDVLGESVRDVLIDGVGNGKSGDKYVKKEELEKKMDFLDDGYRMFFDKLTELAPGVQIFVHGYDYIPADRSEKIINKGWANRYMIEVGVTDPPTRDRIIRHLIDRFNVMMSAYEQEFSFVHFVDNLNTVALDEWMDEIHPNNVGYRKVADNFKRKMKTVNFS